MGRVQPFVEFDCTATHKFLSRSSHLQIARGAQSQGAVLGINPVTRFFFIVYFAACLARDLLLMQQRYECFIEGRNIIRFAR